MIATAASISTPATDTQERIARIALYETPGVGSKIAQALTEYYGSAWTVFEQTTLSELCQFPQLGPTVAQAIRDKVAWDAAEAEWAHIQAKGIQLLSRGLPGYPERLTHCPDAPYLLYYKGNAALNASKVIAVVGTRKPSDKGRQFCHQLMEELQPYQPLVVSGLAYGIDVTTHRRCLEVGLPTLGVVAHGLDHLYPSSHHQVAERMTTQGGLLSEFKSDTLVHTKHFPMRNRIIAALADAVVVVETGRKGGSMITAHFANEYHRDVFAVPGALNDPLAKGCNHLIKTHRACLLESAADLAYVLRWETCERPAQQSLFDALNAAEVAVVQQLLQGEQQLELLVGRTAISSAELAPVLIELELKGIIRALPGKRFQLRR